MEAKEIMDIIAGVLAIIGLVICIGGALYCTYSMIILNRQIKQDLEISDDELAKTEKEE